MTILFWLYAGLTIVGGDKLVSGDHVAKGVQSPTGAVKYPFMVSFKYYSTGGHFCSGSVLSSWHIFTTCQCVVRISGGTARIINLEKFFLLVTAEDGRNVRRKPVKVIVHSGCNKQVHGWEFDFAVVRIDAPLNVSYAVPPSIPSGEKEMNEFYNRGNKCRLVDWQLSFDSLNHFTDYSLTFVDNAECEKQLCSHYGRMCGIKNFREKYVCFTGEGVCHANRGGHLFCSSQFAGIVNWSPICRSGDPLVFSRLDILYGFYKSYRDEQINDYRTLLGQVIRAFIFVCVSFCLFCGIILVVFFYFYLIFARRRGNSLFNQV